MSANNYTDDLELIRVLQNEDQNEEAFEILYHKYYRLVLFIANRECSNDSDAQDILQETFIEVKRSIHLLKNPQYFRLWLYRIVNSKCKDLFRSRKFSLIDSETDLIQNIMKEEHIDAVPEYNMKFTSDKDVLMSLINQLPQKQRIVLIMYYLEQCSIKEIADILAIPEGTVKSRMATAKATLKQKVEQYEENEKIKLSFYSFDSAIATALVYGYNNACVTAKGLKSPKMKTKNQLSQKQRMLVVGACILALGAGLLINLQQPKNDTEYERETSFRTVKTEDQILSTSTEAYFYLLQKACCAEEIERMDMEELRLYKEVYQSLKDENSFHYQLLQDMGWSRAYEKRLSE